MCFWKDWDFLKIYTHGDGELGAGDDQLVVISDHVNQHHRTCAQCFSLSHFLQKLFNSSFGMVN